MEEVTGSLRLPGKVLCFSVNFITNGGRFLGNWGEREGIELFGI